jgi:hypothetical protein
MDAMQNERANAGAAVDENEQAAALEGESGEAETAAEGALAPDAPAAPGDTAPGNTAPGNTTPADTAPTDTDTAPTDTAPTNAGSPDGSAAEVADMPQPRAADVEASSGKGKKRKAAPKPKAAAATKSLVVLREGKVHYADEAVVVLDLDEAAHPDTDVHDVVDKLSELRDAVESPGRTEAVTLVAELIQAKALA